METVDEIAAQVPSLDRIVVVPYLSQSPELETLERHPALAQPMTWGQLLDLGKGVELTFTRVPFDHPLWVLYSSGTTGLPKAIVQGHGGILLEQLKKGHLHLDAHPGDRVFWFTTTGWMMWNFLVGALLTDASIVLYDGNPGYPDMGVLWDLAERTGMTCFGTSASYIAACMKDGDRARGRQGPLPPARGRLDRLPPLARGVRVGLPAHRPRHLAVLDERRHRPLHRLRRGRPDPPGLQGRAPGAGAGRKGRGVRRGRQRGDRRGRRTGDHRAHAVDARVLLGRRGRVPLPVELLRDLSRESGGTATGSRSPPAARAIIYGRSDSTINRGGIRMGTSEIYRAVSSVPEVLDCLVVDVPREGTEGWMPLFVVLRDGAELTDELTGEIKRRIREQCSPRHVPNEIFRIDEVPRTLSGKVLEVPVKRILMGERPERAASRDSLANPAALDYFVELSKAL